MTARFVAFEGGDAAGKSTQVARFAARIDAIVTREPGGTAVGSRVRDVLLDPATAALDPRAEALLMAADRAQHVAEVVRPGLDGGRHVVTDRYLYSSVAYQGHGRDLGAEAVRSISLWATGDLEPDLVVFLDVPVDVARGRIAGRAPDRLEAEGEEFHHRVRDGFLAQAAADPARWLVVDGTAPVDAVADGVWNGAEQRLGPEWWR